MIRLYREIDNFLIENIKAYELCQTDIFTVKLTVKTTTEALLVKGKAYYLNHCGKRKLLICVSKTPLEITPDNEYTFEFTLLNAEKAIEYYEVELASKEASLQQCLLELTSEEPVI
jgi:hypothetical protein